MKNILHQHSTTSQQTIKDNVMYLKKYLLVAFMLLITIIAFSQEEPDVLIGNSNEPEQIIVNVEPVLKSVVSTECTDPDPINCDGVAIVNLDFDEDRMTRLSGYGSIEVGDKFKFGQVAGVGSDIDAIVEIIELHQGYIEDIDVSSEGYDNALQPKFVSYGDFNGDEAWVDFKISFFYCNTSIPANIFRFYGFGVDIDGGYYRNEFQQFNFTGTPDFGAGAAANIDIVNNPPGGYNIRFIDKTNTSADGIPINTWDRMVRMTFEGANSFNWRIGVKYNAQASSAYRLFSLYAKCIPGFAPAENDLGDAPDPYPTLNITLNGAKHVISPSIFLGSNIDAENDGQPSPNADGDDNNGTPDDEDGVFISGSFKNGETKTIVVNAHGTGKLNAWIDWNDDGDWSDAGEQIATDLVLADGNNNVNIDVPCTIGSGFTFARFRYSTNAGLTYEGPASDGEVEDYMVTLDNSNPTPNVEDPANQTKCAGENTNQVTFTGSVDGTIFNWTNNTPSIGLAASGTGNIASFVAINNGTTPVTATITVTPSKNGCVGNPQQFTITVNPNTVTLDPAGPFGPTDPSYQLTGTPSGGTFSGTGVSPDGLFDPSVAGIGNHVITYSANSTFNCPGSDQITIEVSNEECNDCDGKVTSLTLKYLGTSQANVLIIDKEDNTVFNSIVQPNEIFTFSHYYNETTFGSRIKIFLNGSSSYTEIHTSCSEPIGPGMVFGEFLIVKGYSLNGGLLCPPRGNEFGDAPGYCEASHKEDGDIKMGSKVDKEDYNWVDGVDDYGNATDDDLDNYDDEDGLVNSYGYEVKPALKENDTNYSLSVKVKNKQGISGKLHGWIDFDLNGVFDADEYAVVDVPNGTDGVYKTITWNVPSDIKAGISYIRLRLTTDISISSNTPCGYASDGEVEDYELPILNKPPGEEWQFDCGENVDVEVKGVGTDDHTSTTLTFPDLTDVDSIIVEAVHKGGTAPSSMKFESGSQTIIAPRLTVVNGNSGIGIYRAKFDPAAFITLTTSDRWNTHSFVAYVFRSNQNKKASSGQYEGVYLYHKTANLNLPITLGNKDIIITVPISELNPYPDQRIVTITAAAGGINETITLVHPNLGNSLNITPFTLSNVPGTVSNLSIEVKSPSTNGDSFVYGTVVANITCKELPQISCPPADSIQGCSTDDISDFAYSETEVDISESAFTSAGGVIINEGCGVNTITYKDSKTGTNPIVVTRTFTLYDDCGETTDCPQTIKIYDTTPPTIVCPSDKTVGANDNCEYTIEDYTGEATVHDNCTDDAQIIVTQNPTATTVIGLGTTTIWLYAEDELGNIDSCNFTVTVVDSIPPEITAYDTTIYVSETKDNCVAKMIKVRYTASDNCTSNNNLVITQGPDTTDFVPIGDTTVMVIAQDEAGNLDTAYATVHVLDTTDPHLNCPDDKTITGCNGTDDIENHNNKGWFKFSTTIKDITVGEYTSQSTVTTADIWDNCTIDSVTYIDKITYNNNQDTIIVERTFEVTDESGNKSWCIQTFTVVNEGPEAICKPATVYVDSNGEASISVNDINDGSSDACGIDTMWLSNYLFDCDDINPSGVTITLYVADSVGTISTCTSTVTVKDTIKPHVIAKDTTLYVDQYCGVVLPELYHSESDNCTLPAGSVDQSPHDGSTISIGTTTVTIKVTDKSGNTYDTVVYATVLDTTPPTLNCPPNQTLIGCDGTDVIEDYNNNNWFAYSNTDSVIDKDAYITQFGVDSEDIKDNCEIDSVVYRDTIIYNNQDDTLKVKRTFTVWDKSGNSDWCTQTFTIVNTLDVVAVPDGPPIQCYGGRRSYKADPTGGTSPYYYLWDTGSTSDEAYLYGGKHWLRVTDDNGCVATDTFIVSQPDSMVATATVIDSILCYGETGKATVAIVGGPTTSFYQYYWSNGENTQTATNLPAGKQWVRVNYQGCEASDTVFMGDPSEIIITKDTIIDLVCYDDSTGIIAISVNGGEVPYTYQWLGSDVFPPVYHPLVGETNDSLINYPSGFYKVIVTDANNCKDTSRSFIISDPATKVQITANKVNDVTCNGAADGKFEVIIQSPGTAPYEYSKDGGLNYQDTNIFENLAADIYYVMVMDANGCTDTASVTILVDDNENPVARCKGDTVYIDESGNASVTVNDIDNGSTDNCSIDTMWLTKYNFDCSDVYPPGISDTLTVRDTAGNTDFCTATVTVLDTFPPEIEAFGTTIYVDDDCSAKMIQLNFTVSDNCTDSVDIDITQGPDTSQYVTIGDTTVMLIAEDASGNLDTAYAIVHVLDTIDPHLNCPDDQTITGCNGTDEIENHNSNGWFAFSTSFELITVGEYAAQTTVDSTKIWDNCTIDSVTYKDEITYKNNLDTIIVDRTFEVTDKSGNKTWCTQTFTIVNNLDVSINNKTDVLCYGDSTGSATATVNGGVSPYEYKWFNNLLDSIGNATTINNIPAGTYYFQVVDDNGCDALDSVIINQADTSLYIVSLDFENTTCIGDSTGFAKIEVAGGTTPYKYEWKRGSTQVGLADSIINQPPGTYDIIVTDSNGCTINDQVIIQQVDTIKPVITCGEDTVYLDNNGDYTIDITDINFSASDNCELIDTSYVPATFDCSELFNPNVSIYIEVEDASGNKNHCLSDITVLDTISPLINMGVCHADVELLRDANCEAVVPSYKLWTEVNTTDNCAVDSVLQIPAAGTVISNTTLVKLYAWDKSGNVDSCSFNITLRRAPDAVDDFEATNEDTPVDVIVLSNDTDCDNDLDSTSVKVISGPTNGSTTVNPVTGVIKYNPDLNFNGKDTFEYRVCDTTLPALCDTAVVIITVGGDNDPPVAINDSVITPEDVAVVIDVLDNDYDVDGDTLQTVNTFGGPANGNVMILANDSIRYTPDLNFNGKDTFQYVITDGNGGKDTAFVFVTITPVNDPPVAVNDNKTTNEDVPVVIDVQDNDSDPDGDPLTTISKINGPKNGTAVILNSDSIQYSPAPNFNGKDTFQYVISDGNGGKDTAFVYITITPVNDPPVAINDTVITNEDTPVVIDVQDNDYDIDGDPLKTTATLNGPSNGSVNILANDSIRYTPNLNFNGKDTFEYIITDNNGGFDTAFVFITISPINDPPVAVDDYKSTNEDIPVVIDVQHNDSDPDGDPLTTTNKINGPKNGTAVILNADSIMYTPNPLFNGKDTFQYIISDGNGGKDTAFVYISIGSVNNPPVAINDTIHVSEDTTNVFIDVQVNDSDPDGDPLTTSLIWADTSAVGGTVLVVNGDSLKYTPPKHFYGLDSILYQICDNGTPSLCDSAYVFITVDSMYVRLLPKVMLHGALLGTNGLLMQDELRVKGFIPMTEPYTGLGYTHVAGGGGETVSDSATVFGVTGNNAIVDWVFVELRNPGDKTQVVATKSALVQRDGDVVDVDGVSPLIFDQTLTGSYYVSIRHRNHLGAMTATAIPLTTAGTVVDFTDLTKDFWNSTAAYDGKEQNSEYDKYALWAGTSNGDNYVRFAGSTNDTKPIFNAVSQAPNNTTGIQTFTYNGYHLEDINMDAKVRFSGGGNDVSILFNIVAHHPINTVGVQTFSFKAQLPN